MRCMQSSSDWRGFNVFNCKCFNKTFRLSVELFRGIIINFICYVLVIFFAVFPCYNRLLIFRSSAFRFNFLRYKGRPLRSLLTFFLNLSECEYLSTWILILSGHFFDSIYQAFTAERGWARGSLTLVSAHSLSLSSVRIPSPLEE